MYTLLARTRLSTKFPFTAPRVNMGTKLGEKIAREWENLDIDVVIPIPETSL